MEDPNAFRRESLEMAWMVESLPTMREALRPSPALHKLTVTYHCNPSHGTWKQGD